MNPLLEQFLQEARENLAFIDQNIERIGGDDPELLNSVFRAAHTLKGGSGIVGFESVKEITHQAEDLLDMLRAGKITFQEEMLEALYNAFDEVLNLIEAAEETEDIIEADPQTVETIITELKGHMGKDSAEQAAWEPPFAIGDDLSTVVNKPMGHLTSLRHAIPFELGALDEEAIGKEQLYAIVFDVDESCMVYGNDPLYTLSLLGDKVIGLYSCMDDEKAKSVLSGLDDEDGLLLQIALTAFVFATYEEIEEALFNFIDELQFYPLDIVTLLQVRKGETGHQLDVMKEFSSEVRDSIRSGDKEALVASIESTLQLIGKETIQYAQLERVMHIMGAISADDLHRLEPFVVSLERGIAFDPAESTPVANEMTAVKVGSEARKEEALETSVAVTGHDELTERMCRRILGQQLLSLESTSTQEDADRVEGILNRIRPFASTMPVAFEGKAQMMAWLGSELGVETVAVVEEKQEPTSQVEIPVTPPEAKSVEPEVEQKVTKPREETKRNVIGKTVKIEQESIDNMMNIVGELLVAKNSLPYLAQSVSEMNTTMITRAIMEKYTFINRLTEQLQDLIMSMRMLPISYVFDRYPKLVRDISKKLGKKVRLEMDGGDTKLDKNMIEMLADPMIHIMRNSLDHGIEDPEVRVKKGKPAEGKVILNAYAQSDKIIIEIKDDGAGINIDKVVNKVLEKGLLSIEQIDAISEDEKAELVLLPGLSTADEISEYSGRGVGMDVVKKSIESFGGSIHIRTEPNRGTTITLAIPVSLAVTSLLHVSMSGIHYGLPMDSVSETVKIDREEIEYLHNEPFVYIRGEVIPLLFIKSMLDEAILEGEQLPIVVLNIKGNLLAVVVNELLGQLDVVQKPLEGVMEEHPIFSGTSLLGNGQIIMAIDPLGLLSMAHGLKSDEGKVSRA